MKLSLIGFLLFTQFSIAQTVYKANEIYLDALKSMENQNFELAEEQLSASLKLDTENKDAWFNLGITRSILEKKDSACEAYFEAYSRFDYEAIKYLEKYCSNFRNGSYVPFEAIDELPAYRYKGKIYPLFVDGRFNNHYMRLLKIEIDKSKIVQKYSIGAIHLAFNIDPQGNLLPHLMYNNSRPNSEIIEKEACKIFKELVEYIPAKSKGKSVQSLDGWKIAINIRLILLSPVFKPSEEVLRNKNTVLPN